MWWLAAIFALCGCDQVFGLTHGPSTSKPIAIHPTSTTALDDFPVAIFLPTDKDLAADSISDGSDLFVTDDDDVELSSELEKFDVSTGALAMWVRIPVLAGAPAETTIHLRYGRAHTPAGTAADVWSASAGAIFHFGDTTLNRALDSTSSANTLRASDPSAQPSIVPGVVGSARDFDGVDDHLTAGTSATLEPGTRSISFSAWVNVTSPVEQYDMLFAKGGGSPSDPGMDMELGTGVWRTNVADGTSTCGNEYGMASGLMDQWVFLAAVLDREAQVLRVYTDGAPKPPEPLLVTIGSTSTPRALEMSRLDHLFRGSVDEVEIYDRALPAPWIATQYDNLAHTDTFLTVGSAE